MDSVAKALKIMDENVLNSYSNSPYTACTPKVSNYLMTRNVTDTSFLNLP